MNRMMKLMAMVVVLAGAMALTGGTASADFDLAALEREYHDAMWYFVPTTGDWSGEVRDAVNTARVKPENVCQVVLPDLAHRGRYLALDLRGTWTPEEAGKAHDALTRSVENLTLLAESACDDPDAAMTSVEHELELLASARGTILRMLVRGVGDPVAPAQAQPITLR